MDWQTDFSAAPYYDDWDNDKNYKRMLFHPGRDVQGRELTQMQTMLQQQISDIAEGIYDDGDIVSGCAIAVNSITNVATIRSGFVYARGLVHEVVGLGTYGETDITITGSGVEIIGLRLQETILNYTSDSSLRSPAAGYENYGQPGSDRFRVIATFVLDDPLAIEVYKIVDGTPTTVPRTTAPSDIMKLLAERDRDLNGSFRVNGLFGNIEAIAGDTDNVAMVFDPGLVRVEGWTVNRNGQQRFTIPKSTDERSVNNEPYSMQQVAGTAILTYALYNQPVSEITELTGICRINPVYAMVKEPGAIDTLPSAFIPAFELHGIYSKTGGAAAMTWVSVEDPTDAQFPGYFDIGAGNPLDYTFYQGWFYYGAAFHLHDEGLVLDGSTGFDWTAVASPPAAGTTYYSMWTYSRTFDTWVQGGGAPSDYFVEELSSGVWSIRFGTSHYPVPGNTFTIDYAYFLSRHDLLYMTSEGIIKRQAGNPDVWSEVTCPGKYAGTLDLMDVKMPPYVSDNTTYIALMEAHNHKNFRKTQSSLNKMERRIDQLEYNLALSALEEEARLGEPIDELVGIFVDAFVGVSRVDLTWASATAEPTHGAAFELQERELRLPLVREFRDFDDYAAPTGTATEWTRLWTLPFTEEVILLQPLSSEDDEIKPHPFPVFTRKPRVFLSKHSRSYHDPLSGHEIQKQAVSEGIVANWVLAPQGEYDIQRQQDELAFQDADVSQNFASDNVTIDEMVHKLGEGNVHCQQVKVYVRGKAFAPLQENIVVRFDGELVDFDNDTWTLGGFVLTNGTQMTPGSVPGYASMKADADGWVVGSFTVPAYKAKGRKLVEVFDYYDETDETKYSQARINMWGPEILMQENIEIPHLLGQSNSEPLQEQITSPLVQQFKPLYQATHLMFVKGIRLFFKNKDDAGKPITIQLRKISQETSDPAAYVLHEETFQPSSISVSADAATYTDIVFPDPIILSPDSEYGIVFHTDSLLYEMHTAKVGQVDQQGGGLIGSFGPGVGKCKASFDKQVWSTIDKKRIKFGLIVCNFSATGSYILPNFTGLTNFSSFIHMQDFITLPDTSIVWEYSVDGGTVWYPFSAYVPQFRSSAFSQLQIKATLATQDDPTGSGVHYASPVLCADTRQLVLQYYQASAWYVSNRVLGLDDYNTVTQQIKAAVPSGTSFQIYFSPIEGLLLDATLISGPDSINGTFYHYVYETEMLVPPPLLSVDDCHRQATGGFVGGDPLEPLVGLQNGIDYYYRVTWLDNFGNESAPCASIYSPFLGGAPAGPLGQTVFDFSRGAYDYTDPLGSSITDLLEWRVALPFGTQSLSIGYASLSGDRSASGVFDTSVASVANTLVFRVDGSDWVAVVFADSATNPIATVVASINAAWTGAGYPGVVAYVSGRDIDGETKVFIRSTADNGRATTKVEIRGSGGGNTSLGFSDGDLNLGGDLPLYLLGGDLGVTGMRVYRSDNTDGNYHPLLNCYQTNPAKEFDFDFGTTIPPQFDLEGGSPTLPIFTWSDRGYEPDLAEGIPISSTTAATFVSNSIRFVIKLATSVRSTTPRLKDFMNIMKEI